MVRLITSTSNPSVKQLVLLSEKSRARRDEGLIVVEGRREIRLALASGFALHSLYFYPGVVPFSTLLHELGDGILTAQLYEVGSQVYEKIAYREGTEGVIALFRYRDRALSDLTLTSDDPFILVVQSPEKPGNLGGILRTADAAGVDAVIVADPHTDIYHPNVIRSSVGGVFTSQIASGSSDEVIAYLRQRGIRIVSAILDTDTENCYTTNLRGALALVVGTESTGLTSLWHASADHKIMIPMAGKLDSMNLSVSAGILLFEAVRQRRFS